jgi:hypothetical protein
MLELGSGIEHMLQTAMSAELIANDLQSAEKALLMAWATYQKAPDNILANRIYIQALKKNAYMQRSNQIRNYYLSVAKEVERTMPTDTTPPVVNLTAPVNGAYYKSSAVPAAAYTATDNYDPNPAVQVTGWSNAEGVQTMTVTATDAAGNIGSATVTYTVDNTPPIVSITAPANNSYYKTFTLPPAAFSVAEANPYTVVQSGYSNTEGPHTYTVTATDAAGNTGSASVTYTVDNTPPTITGMSANPSVLWPPNQKMVDVTINYNATDNCGQPACQISSVTCNEPISSSNYTIVDGHHVKLSADRLGSGNGRIYTITITCTDASGNSSSQAVKVTVPHDQGKK